MVVNHGKCRVEPNDQGIVVILNDSGVRLQTTRCVIQLGDDGKLNIEYDAGDTPQDQIDDGKTLGI